MRLELISTKLPIVKDLIEILIHTSIDELERYADGSRTIPIHKNDQYLAHPRSCGMMTERELLGIRCCGPFRNYLIYYHVGGSGDGPLKVFALPKPPVRKL